MSGRAARDFKSGIAGRAGAGRAGAQEAATQVCPCPAPPASAISDPGVVGMGPGCCCCPGPSGWAKANAGWVAPAAAGSAAAGTGARGIGHCWEARAVRRCGAAKAQASGPPPGQSAPAARARAPFAAAARRPEQLCPDPTGCSR
eukprot:359914-Rhodomonas_salina.3